MEVEKVRYTRVSLDLDDVKVCIGGEDQFVINISGSGILVKSANEIGEENAQVEVDVHFLDTNIFNIDAKIVRHDKENDTYALEFVTSLPERSIHILNEFHKALEPSTDIDSDIDCLPSEFIKNVIKTKAYLKTIKTNLDNMEQDNQIHFTHENFSLYNGDISEAVAKHVSDRIFKYTDELYECVRKLDPTKYEIAKKFWRENLHEYFMESAFVRRSWEKPQGYAGDYLLMEHIYGGKPLGNSLFSKCMFYWGINENTSKSVRARRNHFRNEIDELGDKIDHPVVCSLACGPAAEIVDFISKSEPSRINRYTFIIFDQDQDALLHAKNRITEALINKNADPSILNAVKVSVKKMLVQDKLYMQVLDKFPRVDLLYSAGLFDYLPDNVASSLIKRIHEWSDKTILGNFSPDSKAMVVADFSGDWQLILRTREEMLELARVAGITADNINSNTDEIGIEIFLEFGPKCEIVQKKKRA